MAALNDTDRYIADFPSATREKLEELRAIIQKALPDATEIISYKMPAYKQDGAVLVYFAGYKNHVGYYPTNSGIEAFIAEMSAYKTSKGAIQFPLDKPLPASLIRKIALFRLNEIRGKAKLKKTKK